MNLASGRSGKEAGSVKSPYSKQEGRGYSNGSGSSRGSSKTMGSELCTQRMGMLKMSWMEKVEMLDVVTRRSQMEVGKLWKRGVWQSK